MKKILVLAFVLLFIFPLSSCNKTPTPTPPENPQEMQTPTFAEVYPATPFSSTAYDTALTDIPARGTIKWEKGSLLVFRTGSPLKVTIYNTETASVVYEKENTDTENYSAKPYLAVETPFFSVLTQSEEDGTTTFETALYDAKGQEFFRIAENITPHIILDLIYVKNTVFRANADGSITQAFTLTSLSYVPKMTDFDTLYGNANYYYGIKNSTTKPLVCIYDQSFRLHMSYEFIGNANKATVGYLANGDLLLQYRTYAHNTDNFTYGN